MKDIKDYEGLYAITEDGKVWSYKKKRFKTPYKQNGYLLVNLYKDGKTKNYRVHRLVAEAYLPNPEKLPEVHHKNSIRIDNRVNNLVWVSKEDNLQLRVFKSKMAKWYTEKLERLGIVFTAEQRKLIDEMG